ncbi:MAG: InlB B-repeat-containing protein [Candidatus Nanoarchaeia archaeon]|jgi:hypothetical protein|nr:InlB B-repeat-containing protein [Candidatus Nanoarchaeia archaeon]
MRVFYDGNGNTGGTSPVDLVDYSEGSFVTVLDKGDLVKDTEFFSCWNTSIDGSGLSYRSGDGFYITEDTTLYAQWFVVNQSYWDIILSGISTSALGEGKTTTEMGIQSTYVGWDFETVWHLDETL